MSKFDTISHNSSEEGQPDGYNGSPSLQYRPTIARSNDRLAELEIENSRLHRLVAELLIKNQQLRKPD
jgi:hypothetical protein